MKRESTMLNSSTGGTGASSAGLFETDAFSTSRQAKGSTLLNSSWVKMSRFVLSVTRHVRRGRPVHVFRTHKPCPFANPSLTGSSLHLYISEVFTCFLGGFDIYASDEPLTPSCFLFKQ